MWVRVYDGAGAIPQGGLVMVRDDTAELLSVKGATRLERGAPMPPEPELPPEPMPMPVLLQADGIMLCTLCSVRDGWLASRATLAKWRSRFRESVAPVTPDCRVRRRVA
jgi:hypothetical protein